MAYRQSELLEAALAAGGVPAWLVPIDGAEHIFDGHDDINAVVRVSVDYLSGGLGKSWSYQPHRASATCHAGYSPGNPGSSDL